MTRFHSLHDSTPVQSSNGRGRQVFLIHEHVIVILSELEPLLYGLSGASHGSAMMWPWTVRFTPKCR